jgi:hypothetical protein
MPTDWPDSPEYAAFRRGLKTVTATDAMRWTPQCHEYFSTFSEGVHDEASYLQVILPAEDVHISAEEPNDLVIGYAGTDGIYFCFRAGMAGVWAYHGIEKHHTLLAETLAEFVPGWLNGAIHV